jgi:hypothetical protein
MNKVSDFFWKILSTHKFNDVGIFTATRPGPISRRAAQDAKAKEVLSVREDGSNRGTFVEVYLKAVGLAPGNPWCMAFIVLRLIKAAAALKIAFPKDVPKTGSTVLFSDYGKKKGFWIRRADLELGRASLQPGDIVFYFFPSKGRIAHTGIVVDLADNKNFFTVEGNTSGGINDSVDRDGQGVYMKLRTLSSLGLWGGAVRLPF